MDFRHRYLYNFSPNHIPVEIKEHVAFQSSKDLLISQYKYIEPVCQDIPVANHLTSSTRTPKFIREQWSNALMAFHQHRSVDCMLVLRQCNLYGHDSFSKFENLVHTHIYA